MILSSNNKNDDNNSKLADTDTSSIGGVDGRKFFLVAVSLILTVPPILLEVYSRIGSFFVNMSSVYDDLKLFPPSDTSCWNEIEHVTLVFHGAGGQDVYTDELMASLKDYDKNKNNSFPSKKLSSQYYSEIVDWSAYSTKLFQASYNGERIGRELARRLLQHQPHLKTVHMIGISVGSFAANAAATEIKQATTTKEGNGLSRAPFVQLTLLDPFTQRGIFGFGYGNQNFGKFADYTEQYLNTDDPVPSTNSPLDHALCYDVTSLRPDTIFGHDWPLVYYARSKTVGQVKVRDDDIEEGQQQRRRVGSVIKLLE